MKDLCNLVSVFLMTLAPLTAAAQTIDIGGYGGSMPSMGGSDFGSFPTIGTRDWNSVDLPTFEEEDIGGPDFPDTLDLITDGIENGTQAGGLDSLPPNVPTTGTLITEEEVTVEHPAGLSLPDPDDFEPEDMDFPFPRIIVGLPDEVINAHSVSPLVGLEQLPSEIQSCNHIPPYNGIDYAMDLREVDLAPEDYVEMHTLWVKSRVCRSGGSLTSDSVQVRILNENDPRCVFYKSDDYKTDLALADTEEERQLIRNLYNQYFFVCF